jgi:isocitrate dehydrogenase
LTSLRALLYHDQVWRDADTCEATKRITRGASRRIAEVALKIAEQRAVDRGSALLTAVHKANVCKQTDGLFLEEVRKVVEARTAKVRYDEALVDSLCAGMVMQPERSVMLHDPFLACIHTHTHTHADTDTDTPTPTHTHTHTRPPTHTHTHTPTHPHTHTHTRVV